MWKKIAVGIACLLIVIAVFICGRCAGSATPDQGGADALERTRLELVAERERLDGERIALDARAGELDSRESRIGDREGRLADEMDAIRRERSRILSDGEELSRADQCLQKAIDALEDD